MPVAGGWVTCSATSATVLFEQKPLLQQSCLRKIRQHRAWCASNVPQHAHLTQLAGSVAPGPCCYCFNLLESSVGLLLPAQRPQQQGCAVHQADHEAGFCAVHEAAFEGRGGTFYTAGHDCRMLHQKHTQQEERRTVAAWWHVKRGAGRHA
eukprot:199022-Chlamydomonas_euryale.AAC.1